MTDIAAIVINTGDPAIIDRVLCLVAVGFLVSVMVVGWALRLRVATRGPKCLKPWAREDTRREAAEIFYKDVLSGGLTPVTHMRHKLHHRCRYCGHEWTSIKVEKLE